MARKKQERGAGKQADEAGDDAIAILTRDHREVEALFDKCKAAADSGEVAGEAGDKTSLIRQICDSLTLHATLE